MLLTYPWLSVTFSGLCKRLSEHDVEQIRTRRWNFFWCKQKWHETVFILNFGVYGDTRAHPCKANSFGLHPSIVYSLRCIITNMFTHWFCCVRWRFSDWMLSLTVLLLCLRLTAWTLPKCDGVWEAESRRWGYVRRRVPRSWRAQRPHRRLEENETRLGEKRHPN